jgi:hypothetical protein
MLSGAGLYGDDPTTGTESLCPYPDPVDTSRANCYLLAHRAATQYCCRRRLRIALSNRLTRTLEAAVLVGALASIPLTLLGEENPAPSWVQTADWTI